MRAQNPVHNVRFVWIASLLCAFALGAPGASQSFPNADPIGIVEVALLAPFPAAPYPSVIPVSGVTGAVTKLTVTLRNFAHEFPPDVDMLLVGPGGQKSVLMSDAGGAFPVTDVTLTFDDAQPGLPGTGLVSGSFAPRDFGISVDAYPPPAPSGPYTASLAVFNTVNPNGDWRLYVVDDSDLDEGSIDEGWSITFVTQSVVCCETPPVLDVTRSEGNVALRWPASATGYRVVAKSGFESVLLWNPVANPVNTTNGTNVVIVPVSSGSRFFQLRK